ncbi:hypothetical protein [Sphingobacterium sp. IITKGP-BTPF85]|uniref:hypothetical protein n=1 Tax=Sphingobacterium sp. IITKGP-BTPF85 TaxID=1338009 RepID=UPI0012E0B02B|nr:hypothetical protein [Sphingobacterium sp. IITKGP-BTPF85]
MSKINSKATYHKAMAYLHKNGYIDYQPSYNPFKGSAISFFPDRIDTTDTRNEPVQNLSTRTINEPYNKQYSNHIINNNMITQSRDKKMSEMKKNLVRLLQYCPSPKKKKIPVKKKKVFLRNDYMSRSSSFHKNQHLSKQIDSSIITQPMVGSLGAKVR